MRYVTWRPSNIIFYGEGIELSWDPLFGNGMGDPI